MASKGILFVTSFIKSGQLFQEPKWGADKQRQYDAYFLSLRKPD
jgi:hypothetical protein